jgi:hypothetical protein
MEGRVEMADDRALSADWTPKTASEEDGEDEEVEEEEAE